MKIFCLLSILLISFPTIQAAEIPELETVLKQNEGSYQGENVEAPYTNDCAIKIDAKKKEISVNFINSDLSDGQYTVTENFIENELTETGPYPYDYYQIRSKNFLINFSKTGTIVGVERKRDTNVPPESCGSLKSIES